VRGASTYAIVAARHDNGIQIVDVSDPSSPVAVATMALSAGPLVVTTFARGGSTYAILALSSVDSIQLLDVSDPSSPVAVGSATDEVDGVTTLHNPTDISTFVRGDSTYAIVTAATAGTDAGIQLLDVSDPSSPVAVGSATDGAGGFAEMNWATGVSTFVRGASTYAIVAAHNDNGIQIVDVSDPSSPVAVATMALVSPSDVSTFVRGNRNYAIVTSTSNPAYCTASWIQPSLPRRARCVDLVMVEVSDPSHPVVVGSATDGARGFTTLGRALHVSTFVWGDSTYAIASCAQGGGRFNPRW